MNLSVQTVQPTVIEGDVQIILRTNEQGKQVNLYSLFSIILIRISVINEFTTAGHVRSNAATKFVSGDITCFERTVPLATQHMAFAGFEKAETLIHNRTTLDGVDIPAVEVVFSLNKNFKREKHQWIYSEASKVISLMSQWTGFPYPLEALRIISAPIQASSHSSLGLITLQDRLVEHPTYTLAHVTLTHSVIQQWLSNVVSVAKPDEACFSESLTVYLEWKLNEELHIVNKTRANEIESIRPQDLSIEGKDETRMLRSLEQLTDELWTVPLEIVGSSGIQLVAVTDKSTILPFTSNDYVIADPRRKSTAMIVYDADSYIRMIRCWDDTRCPANRDAVRGILRDLVAVLLTDRLPPPQLVDIPKWKAVFKFSQNNRILNGNAACCAQYAISR
ncbi:unnamed protein product, partial [Haemonchus placei]